MTNAGGVGIIVTTYDFKFSRAEIHKKRIASLDSFLRWFLAQ